MGSLHILAKGPGQRTCPERAICRNLSSFPSVYFSLRYIFLERTSGKERLSRCLDVIALFQSQSLFPGRSLDLSETSNQLPLRGASLAYCGLSGFL